MAKEFKRSGKDSKGKSSEKRKDSKKGKKPSFERYRDESRPSDFGSSAPRRSSSPDERKRKPFGDKPEFRKKRDNSESEDREKKPRFNKEESSDRPVFRKRSDDEGARSERPSFNKERSSRDSESKSRFSDKPSFRKSDEEGSDRKSSHNKAKSERYGDKRKSGDKPFAKKRSFDRDEKPSFKKNQEDDFYESKPSFVRESDKKDFDYESEYQSKKKSGSAFKPRTASDDSEDSSAKRSLSKDKGRDENHSRPYKKRSFENKPYKKRSEEKPSKGSDDGSIRLNRYIANAGICSRREADDLISSGVVQVNGKVITEMGFKVKPTDVIKYGGQTLKKERLVYLILNKPKDYITTVDDPQQRRTVLELIQGACRERIYPVGRLDRATTGLLMFTNDGELTKKLTHPRYGVRKVYHVELDKPLKRADMDKITEGIELEDGPIKVDEISYVGDGKDKSNVGVEIHSGKNRIVRRIFENFGYNVRKLDRVVFGPLTKKDLPRGRWRMLTEAEIGMMKMISSD